MKKYIEKWLGEGLISVNQAQQMRLDIEKDSSEKSSKRIIFTFSMIGAALTGIGFILFVAANWQAIPSFVKVLILMSFTFSSAFGGYWLKYENKNYPKTGSSLLFLSTILIGALIFLTAQIYHINSDRSLHMLLLIWLLAVLPYAYIFFSRPVACLTSILFILWLTVFIVSNNSLGISKEFPFIYCLTGIFIFCFGKINNFIKDFDKVSPVYIKTGLLLIFFGMFMMTFSYFAKIDRTDFFDFATTWEFFPVRIVPSFLLLSIIMFLVSFFANPSRTNGVTENVLILTAIITCMFILKYRFIPLLAVNLIFALMLLALIFSGYEQKTMFRINLGIFWLIIFIIVKYFDFFWKLLPRSIFFLSGGLLLVTTALFFEHKRRGLKTEIKTYGP
ncbi:MAG: DUF2157 domain-containing protein [Endomicrobium sp.]|nr:DUF2157 domain-containing protein [Endomicrobium sp.]